MWQRFSERARKAVFYAQEVAQQHGSGYVGPQHLVFGCLKEESTASKVLLGLGIEPQSVLDQLQFIDEGKSHLADMTLNPRAKRAIDCAYELARELGHNYIGTEHVFFGSIEAMRESSSEAYPFEIDIEAYKFKTLELTSDRPNAQVATRVSPSLGSVSAVNLVSAILADNRSEAHEYLRKIGLNAHQIYELVVNYLKTAPISLDARLSRASDVAAMLDQPMTSKHIAFAILDLVLDDEHREIAFNALGGNPPEEG
jgi:Clp amino terminal domain, pathogenicity island component